jgi:hypothetical protein
VDLRSWLLADLDDLEGRLLGGVLALVPPERRGEQPGGGASIAWSTFHVARHADLALAALTGAPAAPGGGFGLSEAEEPAALPIDPEAYVTRTLAATRALLEDLEPADLDVVPDTAGALAAAGVPRDEYDWLYRMWDGRPAAFLVRWPLLGHVGNHVGEMIATRNRMGIRRF